MSPRAGNTSACYAAREDLAGSGKKSHAVPASSSSSLTRRPARWLVRLRTIIGVALGTFAALVLISSRSRSTDSVLLEVANPTAGAATAAASVTTAAHIPLLDRGGGGGGGLPLGAPSMPASPKPGPSFIPNPVFLDVSSMWAIGADARMPMVRRTRIPLVTWSGQAVERLERAWRQVQFRATCEHMLYTYAFKWGVTSQMRDYSDLTIVSALTFGRTLMLVEDAPRPRWCAENTWLACFFEPLDGGACPKSSTDLIGVRAVRAWPVPGGTEDIAAALSIRQPVLQLRNVSRFVGVLNDPSLFPHDFWEELLDDGFVQVHDSYGSKVNTREYKRDRPALYHTLALSALRSMLTGIMFRPRSELLDRIKERAIQLKKHHHHCVAVHLRWTDKPLDGGAATAINGSTAHVLPALDRVEQRTGHSYQCLLILSDDDENAMTALQASLGDTYDLIRVSQVHTFFHSKEEYEIYRHIGHAYMLDKALADPEQAYAYYDAVLIDVFAAAEAADYLIGVGSSGVSQLLAQLLGAKRRADGNAFTVWQEDVVVARSSSSLVSSSWAAAGAAAGAVAR